MKRFQRPRWIAAAVATMLAPSLPLTAQQLAPQQAVFPTPTLSAAPSTSAPATAALPPAAPQGAAPLQNAAQPPQQPAAAGPVVLAQATMPAYAQQYYAQNPSPNYVAGGPAQYPVPSNDRVAMLERRIAELETQVGNQPAPAPAPAEGENKTAAPEAVPPGTVVGSDLNLIPKWNFGFEAQTKDKVFRTRFGGQLQFDYTDFNQASQLTNNPIADGGIGAQHESVNFRRLRLRSEGTMYENVGWVVQPDFSNAANVSNVPGNPPGFPNSLNQGGFPAGQTLALVPTLTDCYVTVMKLPVVGNFRLGNFKEPLGLEHLTSSRFLDFMERSYNQDLFYGPFNNGFMPGAMFFNWNDTQTATWALWAGPNQSNLFGYHVGNGEWAGTMRGTVLPYYDELNDGRYLMHFGGSLSARKPDQGQDRFRARGDLRDGPPSTLNTNYVDTGSFNTDFQYLFNAEHLTVWGPWTVQAEYTGTFLQGISYNPLNTGGALGPPPAAQQALFAAPGQLGGNIFFQGGYVECLYFLTGESRGYDRRMGICDRIVPINNFFWTRSRDGGSCGWGAWQVGARYSYTNLDSGPIQAGILNAATFGVNWFLNPNLKFQFNYDLTYRSQVALTDPGWINGAGVRMAFDF